MRSSRIRFIGFVLAGLGALYVLGGFFVLPIVLKRTLVGVVADELGLESHVESAAVNPLALTIDVRGFQIFDHAAEPLLGADRIFVNLETKSIIDGALTWSRIGIEGLRADVVIDEDGALNLLELIPRETETEAGDAGEEEEADGGIGVIVHDLELIGAAVSFTDRSNDAHLELGFAPIDLRVRSFFFGLGREKAGSDIDLEIDLVGGGHIQVAGAIDADPAHADLQIALERFQLSQLEALIGTFARVDVRSGRLNVDGRFVYGSELSPPIQFDGDVALEDVVLHDEVGGADVLRLPRLAFEKIDAAADPLSLHVDRIVLTEPYVRIAIGADGASHFDHILVASETPAEREPQPVADAAEEVEDAPLPDIAIGALRMDDGIVWIDDLSVKPAFTASLRELTGGIKDIDTRDTGKASIQLRGLTGPKAPLSIEGEVKLFGDDDFADVDAVVRNLDLTAFSPYSERFVAYGLARGRMDLDLDYALEGTHLVGRNGFLIDQLTLGERVESKDAVNLPLPLGIALIQDASGRIDIDLGVEGDVDDPAFSVGGLVWKAFVNIMTKAVTQPFGALAALTGGKAPPDEVAFEPGRTRFGAQQAGHLETLSVALEKRPGLAVRLDGAATALPDRAELARDALDVLVRERHFGKPPTAEQMDALLSREERAKAVQRVHAKRVDAKSAARVADESEAQKLARLEREIIATIEISDETLLGLADARAAAVLDYLVAVRGVEADRVRIGQPKIDAQEPEQGGRVDMALEAR